MDNPLMKRMAYGKGVGLLIGVIAFFTMPYIVPDASMMMRVGILLWYPLMGAMIAIFGVIDYHPIFKFRLKAWCRGMLIGGSMTVVLVLIAYDAMVPLMETSVWFTGMSPFWIILDGVIAGVVIDLIATKKAGEGRSLIL